MAQKKLDGGKDHNENYTNVNPKNERMKRQFQKVCKHSKGYDEKTITAIMKAVNLYEEFSNFEDFAKFNDNKAIAYKDFVVNKKHPHTKQKIKLSTVKDYMRYAKMFFKWLSRQSGYKRAINLEHVDCLRLSRKEEEMAIKPQRKDYPTLEMVKEVIKTIPNDEIGRRDKALLSFILCSGGRNGAVASLPIECFDIEKLETDFNAAKGVRVKFGKSYLSYLFIFAPELIEEITNWYRYLVHEKSYTTKDPLFPQTKVEHKKGTKCFEATSVIPEFWQTNSAIEKIVRKRFEDAGFKYYPPHCFKHLATKLAVDRIKTAKELKAVSQNLGHKSVSTTLSCYGVLNPDEQREMIKSLDFSEKAKNKDNVIKELETALNKLKGIA